MSRWQLLNIGHVIQCYKQQTFQSLAMNQDVKTLTVKMAGVFLNVFVNKNDSNILNVLVVLTVKALEHFCKYNKMDPSIYQLPPADILLIIIMYQYFHQYFVM